MNAAASGPAPLVVHVKKQTDRLCNVQGTLQCIAHALNDEMANVREGQPDVGRAVLLAYEVVDNLLTNLIDWPGRHEPTLGSIVNLNVYGRVGQALGILQCTEGCTVEFRGEAVRAIEAVRGVLDDIYGELDEEALADLSATEEATP